MSPQLYLGLVLGVIMGAIVTYAVMFSLAVQGKKAKESWESAIGKNVLYSLLAQKRYSREGERVLRWGGIAQGKVEDVKSNRRIVKIDSRWFKWSEVQLIEVQRDG